MVIHLLPRVRVKIKCITICKVLRTVPGTSSNSSLKVKTEEQMLLIQCHQCSKQVQGAKGKKRKVPNPAWGIREVFLEGMILYQRDEGD